MKPSALERASNGRFGSLIGPADRPIYAFGLLLIVAFGVEMLTGGPGRWGLSAQALAEGRWWTILTHMFSHGSFAHWAMNVSALAAFASPLIVRFGWRAEGQARLFALFLLSGLTGAALYLALHPTGALPMVGASGAICGLWGGSMRLPPEREAPLLPLGDAAVLRGVRSFAFSNVVLFAILFVLTRGQGGLAWEAHLGGLIVGLLALPKFLRPRPAQASAG